jgi:hypothetical protein
MACGVRDRGRASAAGAAPAEARDLAAALAGSRGGAGLGGLYSVHYEWRSTLLMRSFCMQHQVMGRAPLAATDARLLYAAPSHL